MILPIVKFGHPVLRQKGARIQTMTTEIDKLIADMFETMYEAAGIGLAAQQVARALQLTVIDVRGVKDRPSTLEIDAQPVDVAAFMPLVLINPQITPFGPVIKGPEGCLSFPDIYEEISRPGSVEVHATDANGGKLHFNAGGLLGRAIQHETDHLNGILFIDRMSGEAKAALKPELNALQTATKAALAKGNPGGKV
jgi:peptide deformylase